MIQFLYKFYYDEPRGIPTQDIFTPISFQVRMAALADKYDISSLKQKVTNFVFIAPKTQKEKQYSPPFEHPTLQTVSMSSAPILLTLH